MVKSSIDPQQSILGLVTLSPFTLAHDLERYHPSVKKDPAVIRLCQGTVLSVIKALLTLPILWMEGSGSTVGSHLL
jgi:hypothetical protein